MDLKYIFENDNATGVNGRNFLDEQPSVAIPYLTVISLVMASGCAGNTLVIAAVMTNKVSEREATRSDADRDTHRHI